MRIGIIGAGQVGTTLGGRWAAAGHDVIYGGRTPRATSATGARVVTIREAVVAADAVVLATPWAAVDEALGLAGDFGGKPLIDVTNPIASGFSLALGHTTSGAEHIAAGAPTARVVKAFNTTGLENMADPRYGERRVVMPIAGDDPDAVGIAVQLAEALGSQPVALPALARARELEPLAVLWIKLAIQLGHGRNIAFGLARRTAADGVSLSPTPGPKRTILVVGTGHIGGALAHAWLAAGHRVRLAVRDADAPEVRGLVARGAVATDLPGAAEVAEVVVFAVPAGAVVETAGRIGSLAGKVVVDCTNAIAKGFTLQLGHTTSSSEELAKALPGARVVRAFNQQGAEVLGNPIFAGTPATNFIAADDPEARTVVSALSVDAGLDSVEVGGLASSRELEPIPLLWIAMAQALGTREFGLSLMRR